MSRRIAAVVVAAVVLLVVVRPIFVKAQAQSEEIVRRAKSKVQPAYPDLAKKMSISGVAKIEVSSFVSPRAVPNLRDAAEVFAGIGRRIA